jgi:phytoene synthase
MLALASSWNSGLCRHDMTIGDPALTPPQLLALRHAPISWRNELRFLLLFDARMQSVVIAGREPLLTRMKLAWWREALNKPANQRPKGEPLLAEISMLEGAGAPLVAQAAELLVDAWEEVADPDQVDAEVLARHRQGRGDAVFVHFAGRAGEAENLRLAGQVWSGAVADSQIPALPRSGRAFALLARASLVEQSPSRLSLVPFFWHALTGF